MPGGDENNTRPSTKSRVVMVMLMMTKRRRWRKTSREVGELTNSVGEGPVEFDFVLGSRDVRPSLIEEEGTSIPSLDHQHAQHTNHTQLFQPISVRFSSPRSASEHSTPMTASTSHTPYQGLEGPLHVSFFVNTSPIPQTPPDSACTLNTSSILKHSAPITSSCETVHAYDPCAVRKDTTA